MMRQAARTISTAAQKAARQATLKNQKRTFLDFLKPLVFVRHQERAVLEKLGKYDRTLEPGLHFKIPIVENIRKTDSRENRVDMRERVEEMPRQDVITKDNVVMGITALVYYEVIDAAQSIYGIENLPNAINKLAQTTLRNLIGTLHLDQTLTSRESINTQLGSELENVAKNWGIRVTRVELQEVNPPEDIRIAMEREMTSERNRRAVILDAEGEKRAAILRSEGIKASAILEAEGAAEARLQMAGAEKEALLRIQKSLEEGGKAGNYLMGLKYMEMLPKMTKGEKGKTVVVPYDAASLVTFTEMVKAGWSKD